MPPGCRAVRPRAAPNDPRDRHGPPVAVVTDGAVTREAGGGNGRVSPVELYVAAGGGHAWPGSRGSKPIAAVVGRTTFSISADAVMWRFFVAQPLTARD